MWHCDFTNNGAAYSMVWDNSYSAGAKANDYCTKNLPSNPYVCGNTTYTVLPQYTGVGGSERDDAQHQLVGASARSA